MFEVIVKCVWNAVTVRLSCGYGAFVDSEFLIHMVILKCQKSALEMAWRPRYEQIVNGETN